ncbi:TIGR00725 family protein [Candidatus Viridilinea mediisalina]|uniref:TIGR00725 family protein n=2 Tax=Candidatus Viridilinea mediisalina TaxID=2024553 RepID=A0A2A6RLA2_9CHLR|nr:TIGR00725 family protein [Candidatus Viridilinea mediisalina]
MTIIGVMGDGQVHGYNPHAYELGTLIALAGFVLLTGGGAGVMHLASQGAHDAGGLVVGILPSEHETDPKFIQGRYPNPYVHIPIFTGMGDARNVINVTSSDVVVALCGGAGTLSEIALALKAGKHVIILDWPDLTLPDSCPNHLVHYVDDAQSALEKITEIQAFKTSYS